MVTIVIVVVAVALLWTGLGGVLLAGACWGALSGAVIGGVSGGLTSMANGGSFLEGFEDGAFSGALIATETGFARTESIKSEALVLSINADTMETGYKKVLEKYVRKTRELVHIIAGGEEIISTPDHPYYVAGRGFVNVCQLCIGSPLLDADGRVLETEQIYKEYLEEDEEVTVYNFQVEEWHTYHVGEMEVLVHNAEYGKGSGSKFKDAFDLADNYNLSDNTFNNHILDRHGPNSLYGNKSHFNADFDIKNGIDSTLKGDNFIIKYNTAGRGGYIFEQTFTNPIGTNSKGKPLYTIKVVIDEVGNVVTAFPKK